MQSQVNLNIAFSTAIETTTRHTQMEGLYDALAHLSDALSGLASRPRIADDGPGALALVALDDFIMDQIDAVKNRALALRPTEWPDESARHALLLKHVARFRNDTQEMLEVVSLITAEMDLAQAEPSGSA